MAENKSVPHSFTRDGVYYFIRRVPSDLRHYYTSSKISYSLRTRSAPVAMSRAVRAAQKLDEYWYHLRIQDVDLPGKHMLRRLQNGLGPAVVTQGQEQGVETITLSEAVGIYLRLKGAARPVTFHRAAERSCGYAAPMGPRSLRTLQLRVLGFQRLQSPGVARHCPRTNGGQGSPSMPPYLERHL